MERPASIVTFERCYLGAWIVGIINTALSWQHTNAMMAEQMAANPAAQQLGPSFGSSMMLIGLLVGAVITLLLWYFVAKRGSVVAKWIVTVFYAFGLLSFLYSLAMSRGLMTPLALILGVVAIALQGVAVYMLFKPDTKAWFGETPVGPGTGPGTGTAL